MPEHGKRRDEMQIRYMDIGRRPRMDLVVPLERVTVAIEGAVARFPVRRVYCVGRNYLDHIRETAGAEGREPPLFF